MRSESPFQPCMLWRTVPLSLDGRRVCSAHTAHCPSLTTLHAFAVQRRHRLNRPRILPNCAWISFGECEGERENRIGLPVNLLQPVPGPGRSEPSKVNGRTSEALQARVKMERKGGWIRPRSGSVARPGACAKAAMAPQTLQPDYRIVLAVVLTSDGALRLDARQGFKPGRHSASDGNNLIASSPEVAEACMPGLQLPTGEKA